MGTEKIEESAQKSSDFIFESNRLQTFKKNWKKLHFKNCTPESFAAAGFYNYVTSKSSDDTVKCFACQKELSDWEEDDDPWQEHVKRGGKCPFLTFKKKENPTIKDFLVLQFEVKKTMLICYLDENKETISERGKLLLKKVTDLGK